MKMKKAIKTTMKKQSCFGYNQFQNVCESVCIIFLLEDEFAVQELEKIKREREAEAKKAAEQEQAEENAAAESAVLRGNPLLNKDAFVVKRRWDDDVVFKNQALCIFIFNIYV